MSDTLIQAALSVPDNSPFDWVTVKGDRYLTDFISLGRRGRSRHRLFDPREVSWLHHRFADLDQSEAAIRDFANNWGNLGGSLEVSITLPNRKGQLSGVTLAAWQHEIAAVRQALAGTLKNPTTVINANLRSDTAARLLRDATRGDRAIYIVPTCLIGAIWLQTAQTLAGDHTHRKCDAPACANWFRINPAQRGPKPVYCSKTCAKRAERAGLSTKRGTKR